MLKILVDMPEYAPSLDILNKMPGVIVKRVEKPEEKKRLLPRELIEDCDILFCSTPPKNHREMKSLKFLQISTPGSNVMTGEKLGIRNIKVCNATGVFDVPVGEWNMAMMINLARDVRGMIRNQEEQVWDGPGRFSNEIHGAVVGIWGYGGIGRETARLAKSFQMKVHVLSRSTIKRRENIYHVPGTGDPLGLLPDRVFLMKEKDEFLEGIDFLVMALPQTESTQGIVGEAELRRLHPHAFLLNPVRGSVIRHDALLKALREGWIAGAALDAHYNMLLSASHPSWKLDNVILAPQLSGWSAGPRFLERIWDIFVRNVNRFQNGEPLLNELR